MPQERATRPSLQGTVQTEDLSPTVARTEYCQQARENARGPQASDETYPWSAF